MPAFSELRPLNLNEWVTPLFVINSTWPRVAHYGTVMVINFTWPRVAHYQMIMVINFMWPRAAHYQIVMAIQTPSIKKNPSDMSFLSSLFLSKTLLNSCLSTPFLLARRADLIVGGSCRSHHPTGSGRDFVLQVPGGDLGGLDSSDLRRRPISAPTDWR